MSEMLVRLAVMFLFVVLALVLVSLGHRIIEAQHQRALRSAPIKTINVFTGKDTPMEQLVRPAHVSILSFSSEDCTQCRQLQAPVLRRVVEAKGEDVVAVITIDTPTSPELARRYHVLTVPTTVLLDTHGQAHAVNYGFTNAQSLLKQVDAILALENAQEALS